MALLPESVRSLTHSATLYTAWSRPVFVRCTAPGWHFITRYSTRYRHVPAARSVPRFAPANRLRSDIFCRNMLYPSAKVSLPSRRIKTAAPRMACCNGMLTAAHGSLHRADTYPRYGAAATRSCRNSTAAYALIVVAGQHHHQFNPGSLPLRYGVGLQSGTSSSASDDSSGEELRRRRACCCFGCLALHHPPWPGLHLSFDVLPRHCGTQRPF